MMSGNNGRLPTYNLKAVVQETGIKPDTLRAWERRYGLPTPHRTPGGHRLYSQHDIEMLKWLIARQDEGLSISRAVDMWQALEEKGENPLDEGETHPGEPADPTPLAVGETIVQTRQNWIAACLNFDEQRAESILAQAFALYAPETVCIQIIQKGLSEIGAGWAEGRISAQQEHFASALAMRRLENLIAASPPPTRSGRVLVGCPPEEEHTFAPLLLTLLLRRRGWDVLFLGANIPLARLETTIEAARPHLVILTAQTLPTAASLLGMARLLEQAGVPMAYGGGVFNLQPTLRQRIPGHYLGEEIAQATAVVEQLLTTPRPLKPVIPTSPSYETALCHYRERQARLEAVVWESQHTLHLPPQALAAANRDLGRYIQAALTLGDMRLVSESLAGLSQTLHLDARLESYLQLYTAAMRQTLDEPAAPILAWMAALHPHTPA